jgi:hypothetical protein
LKKLKRGTTEGGGGPGSLVFLKEGISEKVKIINKSLFGGLSKSIKET